MAFDKKLNLEVIKTPKDSLTILTDSVLPGETNALNNLFGGELLARMDRAASISARRHSEQIVVTSSVNNVSFAKLYQLELLLQSKQKFLELLQLLWKFL